jgi:hypothetical protein
MAHKKAPGSQKEAPLTSLVATDLVEQRILLIRGQKVMLDADLAQVYGVTTKRLLQQVYRNRERFPADFMFQLKAEEMDEVVANCNHLKRLKFSTVRARAFTEHGAVMLASVLLNTPTAIHASIQVVRAFMRLRAFLQAHKQLGRKLSALEKKYDSQFKEVFDSIRDLMHPPVAHRRRIGFVAGAAR